MLRQLRATRPWTQNRVVFYCFAAVVAVDVLVIALFDLLDRREGDRAGCGAEVAAAAPPSKHCVAALKDCCQSRDSRASFLFYIATLYGTLFFMCYLVVHSKREQLDDHFGIFRCVGGLAACVGGSVRWCVGALDALARWCVGRVVVDGFGAPTRHRRVWRAGARGRVWRAGTRRWVWRAGVCGGGGVPARVGGFGAPARRRLRCGSCASPGSRLFSFCGLTPCVCFALFFRVV